MNLNDTKRQLLVCHDAAVDDLTAVRGMIKERGPQPELIADLRFLTQVVRLLQPSYVRGASAVQITALWQAVKHLSVSQFS